MAQQTLEEVVENIFGLVDPILGKSDYRLGYERGLIDGVKWQAERMYSEEEVIELIQFLSMNQEFNGYGSVSEETAKHFLEQFKNNQ